MNSTSLFNSLSSPSTEKPVAFHDATYRRRIKYFIGHFTAPFLFSIILSVISARPDEFFSTISILSTITFGIPFLLSIWLCRQIYAILFGWLFIAYGVNTPLFMQKEGYYTRTGWTAIGDFDFSTSQLVDSFVSVIIIVYSLLFISLSVGTKISLDERQTRFPEKQHHASSKLSGFILCIGLLLIGIPINEYMYANRIAQIGVVSGLELPFRLTGILYYGRLFLVPALIMVLLNRSSLSWIIILVCLTYSYVAGVAGLSRHVLVFSSVPILLALYFRKHYIKLAVSIGLILVFYGAISNARALLYTGVFPEFFSLCFWGVERLGDSNQLGELLWSISARLYGAQEVVLANQWSTASPPPNALLNTLWSGVPADDIVQQVYGFTPPMGQATGLGLVAGIIWASQGNFVQLILSAVLLFMVFFVLETAARVLLSSSRHFDIMWSGLLFATVLLVMEGRLIQALCLPFMVKVFAVIVSVFEVKSTRSKHPSYSAGG